MISEKEQLTTLDTRGIDSLVETFYQSVRQDAVLAPIFEAAIEEEAWPRHLERMKSFWSTVLLSTGQYRGRPVPLHAALPGLSSGHFEHWLALFRDVAQGIFEPELANAIAQMSERIGEALARASLAPSEAELVASGQLTATN